MLRSFVAEVEGGEDFGVAFEGVGEFFAFGGEGFFGEVEDFEGFFEGEFVLDFDVDDGGMDFWWWVEGGVFDFGDDSGGAEESNLER